ncbi:hypothetical protein B0H13DRAFT_1891262 [Mycena leptocephala]|nr:hypothetical protein B0H13DRAFT_1891262 [Mycena leptocephala]
MELSIPQLRGARKHPVHVKSARWIGADVQWEGKPTGGERGEGQVVEFDVAQAQGHQQKDRDGGVLGFLPGPSPSGSLPPTPILESDFHHPPAQAWWQDRPMQMQMYLPGKPDCMLDMVNVPSVPSVITIPALPVSETLQFPRGFQRARACTASTSTPRLPAQRQHGEHRASQSIPVRAAAAATFAIRAPPRRVGVLRDHDPHGDVHAARRCQVYPTKVQSRLCASKSSRNSRSALGTSPLQRKPSILGLGLGTSLGKSSGGGIGIGTGLPSVLTIGRSATGGKASTASSVGGPAFVPHANPNNAAPTASLMPPLDVRDFVVDAVPKMRRCTAASSGAGDFSSPTEYSEHPWGSLSLPIKSSRTLAQKRVATIRCNRGIAVFHPPQRATLGLPLAARQVVADASAKTRRHDTMSLRNGCFSSPTQASQVAADTGVETRDAICCHREMAA